MIYSVPPPVTLWEHYPVVPPIVRASHHILQLISSALTLELCHLVQLPSHCNGTGIAADAIPVPLQLHVHATTNKTCRFIVFVQERSSVTTRRSLRAIFWSKTIFQCFTFNEIPCGRPLATHPVTTFATDLSTVWTRAQLTFLATAVCVMLQLPITPLCDLAPTKHSTLQDTTVMLVSCYVDYMRHPPPPHSKPAPHCTITAACLTFLHWNCPIARWRTQAIQACRTTLSTGKPAGMIILLVTGPYIPVRCFDINRKTEENPERSGNWNRRPTWSKTMLREW